MTEYAKALFQRKHRAPRRHPSPKRVRAFGEGLLALLFPQRANTECGSAAELEAALEDLTDQLAGMLASEATARAFFERVPEVETMLERDARYLHEEDPASVDLDEVVLCYPGFHATAVYRLAHELHALGAPVFARMLTEWVHERTGIDIHPGAKIGCPFFLDHGTGVVIGETAQLGDRVKIFQGVTIGAMSVDKSLRHKKRHPTLEDDCLVYANATILGGDTVIGKGSVIGGNVWITASLPPGSRVKSQCFQGESPP